MVSKHHSLERLGENSKKAVRWLLNSSTGDDYKTKLRKEKLLPLSMYFEIHDLLLLLKLLDWDYDVIRENVIKITERKLPDKGSATNRELRDETLQVHRQVFQTCCNTEQHIPSFHKATPTPDGQNYYHANILAIFWQLLPRDRTVQMTVPLQMRLL